MSLDVAQAVFAVIALGALVAAWAFLHFHAPLRAEDVRFSVLQQRYYLSLGVHICGILAIYGVLILFFLSIVDVVGARQVVWAALISAVFVRLVMPHISVTADILDRLQSVTLAIAQFPSARENLVALIAMTGFKARNDANDELIERLAVYGVASKSINFLSESTRRCLLEVCSIRHCLLEFLQKSNAPQKNPLQRILDLLNALFAVRTQPLKLREFLEIRRFRQFWAARAAPWTQLAADYQRLFRRSARALLLIEDINEQISDDEALNLAISNFIAEESEEVLGRYRRLIAEAALSCQPQRAERAEFLAMFGYPVEIPLPLPLRPWVIVFALDFLLFLIPSVIMLFADVDSQVQARQMTLFACVHAISQTVAITWAIYPKMMSNFARPSLYSFPWQSYVVYGLASYLSGAMILFLFRLNIPMSFPIVLPTLVSSLSFLIMTVGISFLIDRRLKSISGDFQQGRLRDGAVMALLGLLSTVTFQIIIFHVAPRLGLIEQTLVANPNLGLFIVIRTSFVVLSGSLGFVIGYIVPSAAAAYLQQASFPAHINFDDNSLPGALGNAARPMPHS
jgi:hypothetical protein